MTTYSYSEVLNNIYDPDTDGIRLAGPGGSTYVSSASFSRPNNATAYSVNDVVSNNASTTTAITFSGSGRVAGGGGYITKARLITDQSTNTAQFRLWIFTSTPTISGDNVPFTRLWENRSNEVGYIDIPALSTEGTGSNSAGAISDTSRLAFVCVPGITTLYGILETRTAFTPSSGQSFYVELTLEQN